MSRVLARLRVARGEPFPRLSRGSHRPPGLALAFACTLAYARVLARVALAGVVLGGMAACAGRGSQPTVVPSEATRTPDVTSTPGQVSAPPLARIALSLDRAWGDLDEPLLVTHAGDGSGRVFIVEKTGRIRVVRDGTLKSAPYLDLSARVSGGGEQGLLGLAFSPMFAGNGHFYVNYTDASGATNVVRYEVADAAVDTAHVTKTQVVLRIAQPYSNHNGGCIAFGPDSYLYVGMGDGGSAGDPQGRAQNPKALLGKILRIDVGEVAALPSNPPETYRIPSNNPFAAGTYASQGYRPEIWALGLRNPWRFSFDSATGDLWIGDVGQNTWEEIDFQPAGAGGQNYGWRVFEGTHPYPASSAGPSDLTPFTMPVVEYPHPTGESVTGGFVYRGQTHPALQGVYLYADYVKGKVWGLRLGGTTSENVLLANTGYNISSFGEDEAGELYVCDISGGAVYRLNAKAK